MVPDSALFSISLVLVLVTISSASVNFRASPANLPGVDYSLKHLLIHKYSVRSKVIFPNSSGIGPTNEFPNKFLRSTKYTDAVEW